MERVIYLLGAGFSAPLGIPVMNDFYAKSVEIYESNPQKYAHFDDVFKYYNEMSASSNYYSTRLANIEDLLSMLQMGRDLEIFSRKENVTKYIADVIRYCTPSNNSIHSPTSVYELTFGDSIWQPYGAFVAGMLHVLLTGFSPSNDGSRTYVFQDQDDSTTEYSVVTLNYDLVLEDICGFMIRRLGTPVAFLEDKTERPMRSKNAYLAKLHGSIISPDDMIPPIWNKSIATAKIRASWKFAHDRLSDATQIRIIGYSLPITDSYVKYLLRTAIKARSKLKQIDVVCRDADGTVKGRYDEFIRGNYRFKNSTVQKYLSGLLPDPYRVDLRWPDYLSFDKLEQVHSQFFE